MPLTPDQMQTLRRTLMEMKKETEHVLRHGDHFGTDSEMIKESMGELSNYDNHPADDGTTLFEREKDLALNEHAQRQLEEIERALRAIDEGTYGVCQTCGKEIPFTRLEAHPTATRCVDHSEDRFVSLKRPAEEAILRPPFGKFEYDESEHALFDSEDAWQRVASWGTSETPSDFFEQAKFSYNEMYPESDEPTGFVEAIESFVATDMSGGDPKVIPNVDHEAYEEQITDSEWD